MKLRTLLSLFCLTHLCSVNAGHDLPRPDSKSKILVLLSFTSESHFNVIKPLINGLADRGHELTLITPLPPRTNKTNIREIRIEYEVPEDDFFFELREKNDPTSAMAMFETTLPRVVTALYNSPEVLDMYERRNEFDLLMADEAFNEAAYPFLVGKNYVTIGTAGLTQVISAVLGNVLNPAYYPSYTTEYERPYSFANRIRSIFNHAYLPAYWRRTIHSIVRKDLLVRFPDLPPFTEIEKGNVLVFVNSHFSMDVPTPLLPSQVEIGGIHCKPGNPLPKDLQSFIEGSGKHGAIYFSLGSVCKGITMPQKYISMLIQAFSKLKQRVIWKFEGDLDNLPNNTLVRKWLPQQDILAHAKVKLFISHGGLLSAQETIYHAKPMLALPIFADQQRNGQNVVNKGFGKALVWEELTTEIIVSSIHELIDNPKYTNRVRTTSAIFRDQPVTPLQKAVWWTEYVMRHKGADSLKSPAADLTWVEYLMIDVIVTGHILIFLLYLTVKKLLCFCGFFNRRKSILKKKQE